jgi:hypothetical protein
MRLDTHGDDWNLRLTPAEAVTLHEVIARAEWATDLRELETADTAEREVLSRVQQAIAPSIEELGTESYDRAVNRAWAAVNDSR